MLEVWRAGTQQENVQAMTFTETIENAFDQRLERLNRLRNAQVPWVVISREVGLMIKALTLHPEACFWRGWGDSLLAGFRNDIGYCAECDRQHRPQTDCPQCIAEFIKSGESHD